MRRTQSQGSAVLCCPWIGIWCSGSGSATADLDGNEDIEGVLRRDNYYQQQQYPHNSGGRQLNLFHMGAGLSSGHHHQSNNQQSNSGGGSYHQSYLQNAGGYHVQTHSGGQQDGAAPLTMAEVVRERKRKINGGLATLRRRLLAGKGGRRGARAQDRAAPLRDMLREWSPSEVAALLEEYEALAALRDLVVQAELARPPAAALRGDLASLYDNRICPDVELVFKGSSFPVHRAILSARCPYFRDLLNNYPNSTPRISLEVGTLNQHVDPAGLDVLLRYLYAGEPAPQPQCGNDGEVCEVTNTGRRKHNNANVPDCCPTKGAHNNKHGPQTRLTLDIVGSNASSSSNQWQNNNSGGSVRSSATVTIEPAMLRRLAHELGAQPAQLHRDMKHLLDSGENADATLVFTWEPVSQPANANPSGSPSPEFPFNGGNNRNAQNQSSSQQHHPQSRHQGSSANSGGVSGGAGGNTGASQDQNGSTNNTSSNNSWDYGFRPKMEMACHRAVLSARSPFFRSVIQRRFRLKPADQHNTVKIVLDERVIPHKYARVLLHAVYTDQVDLNLVMRGSTSIFGCSLLGNHGSSLGEAQALTGNHQSGNSGCPPGRNQSSGGSSSNNSHAPSPLEEAMELYEIGRFLELDILSQGCEDIIAERLSATSLAAVLKWSSQPHGSRWVHRQALRYLREEFLAVAAGPALPQLEIQHLCHTLRCPFLQASELDALRAVLRWGEHRLVKRMEDREPNLLTHTAHSVSRKGVKKRDLSDTELREVLADILPLVRIDHILPQNSELLTQAIRRGLVSSPPSCMLGDDGGTCSRADAWIRGKGNHGVYVRPRLYMPYYEEVKALLEDQMVQETELARMRRARYIPDIPDTLYMVSAEPRARSSASVANAESPGGSAPTARSHTPDQSSHHRHQGSGNSSQLGCGLGDGSMSASHNSGQQNNSNNSANNPPPPSPRLLRAVLERERELRRSPACVRATSLPLSHTHEITRQIRLRVVREFNLPDSVADTLEGVVLEEDNDDKETQDPPTPQEINRSIQDIECDTDQELAEIVRDRRHGQSAKDCRDWNESPSGRPNSYYSGDERSSSLDSNGPRGRRRMQNARGLSDAMPDVAMATSSLNRLRISSRIDNTNGGGTMSNHPNSSSSHHCGPADNSDIEDSAFIKTYNPPEAFRYQGDHSSEDKGESRLNSMGFNSMSREMSAKMDAIPDVGRNTSNRRSTDYSKRSGNYCDDQPRSSSSYQYNRDGRNTVADGYCKTVESFANICKGDAYAAKVSEKSSENCLMVAFMNPNQHLLQEGAYRGHYWRGKGDGMSCQQYPVQHNDSDVMPSGLQLDLGDGNQHVSPARHTEAVPQSSSSWNRQTEARSRKSSTLPPEYTTHSQQQCRPGCPPSPGRQWCASYTGYLAGSGSAISSSSSANTPTSALAPTNRGFSTLQHRSRSPRAVPGHATLQRPRPICPLLTNQGQTKADGTNTCNLSGYQCSNVQILNSSAGGNISGSAQKQLNCVTPVCSSSANTPCGNVNPLMGLTSSNLSSSLPNANIQCSTVQQCSVSNCTMNAVCNAGSSYTTNQCNISNNPVCSTSTNVISTCVGVSNCSGVITTASSSQAGSIAGTPMCDKDIGVHRSHSAGSISSIGAEVEKREQKSNVQNVSGFNQPLSYSSNEANILSSSPRHFRSISTLPETLSWDGLSRPNTSRSHYTPDPMSWSTQESQFSRNVQDTNTAYSRNSHDSYARNPQEAPFARNSREFYNNYRVSPFQGDYLMYARGDSPFSCISQQPAPQQAQPTSGNQRPGSCGLADVIPGSNYGQSVNSRGESPLYSTSRGNSPFRALDGTPTQFSRTSSPYSSGHRMEFTTARNDRLIENYCQNVQRSSSPGCRTYSTSSMQRNSPSNLKLQQSARGVLSASPSSAQQQKQQRNSPISNFSQSSLKLQRSVTDISSALSYTGSQKQQRICSSPNYQKCSGNELQVYGQQSYNIKSTRNVAQSPSLTNIMSKQDGCHLSQPSQDCSMISVSNQQGNQERMNVGVHLSERHHAMSSSSDRHSMMAESRHNMSTSDSRHSMDRQNGSHSNQSDNISNRPQSREDRYYKLSSSSQYQMSSASGNTPRYL